MSLKKHVLFCLGLIILWESKIFSRFGMVNEPLNESDNDLFLATERSVPESWYSRVLDLSMRIWADFDMLQRGSNMLLPDHLELVFDASIGKLVHLNWSLDQMIRHKSGVIVYDDVRYFIQIMQAVNKYCTTLLAQDMLVHKAESTQEIIQQIMDKIDKTFLK